VFVINAAVQATSHVSVTNQVDVMAAVVVTTAEDVKSVSNAIVWGILHATAKKTPSGAIGATVRVTSPKIVISHQTRRPATIVINLDT